MYVEVKNSVQFERFLTDYNLRGFVAYGVENPIEVRPHWDYEDNQEIVAVEAETPGVCRVFAIHDDAELHLYLWAENVASRKEAEATEALVKITNERRDQLEKQLRDFSQSENEILQALGVSVRK